MNYDITDLNLAAEGALKSEWADQQMPVLQGIRKRFAETRPLEGVRIAACLHVTSETSNLAKTLVAGGAELALCASNPLSTQDDIAAHLVSEGIAVFARNGEDSETYYNHISATVETKPHLTIDDGADLVAMLHSERRELLDGTIGGMEETTTGVIRLKALHAEGKLAYPIIAVNDAMTKHMFDNRYGTGQSTLDGIIRATNMLITGKSVVIIGYGWCGRGFADRARGLGAHTIVCEVDPVRALEAVMDGHRVMSLDEASKIGDIFLTVTGGLHAIDKHHFENMKSGAIVANSGHFNVEINIDALREMSEHRRLYPSIRGRAHFGGWATHQPACRRQIGQLGRRRGTSAECHGYELCEPGTRQRIHRIKPRESRAGRPPICLMISTSRSPLSSSTPWA